MSMVTRIEVLSSPTLKIALVTPDEQKGKSFMGELEERLDPDIPYEKLEQLYFTSGLIFKIIDKWTTRIISQGIYFEGKNKDVVKEYGEWAKRIKLKTKLANGIRDIFLAGGCWGEKILNESKTDIVNIKTLNPKTMDYLRKGATNEVELDEYGNPLGYVRKYKTYQTTEWRKDKVVKGGEDFYKAEGGEDLRKRIYYFKFWGLSESLLGYTPLVSVYKDELIRLNIADGVGESAFRGTGIIATIKTPENVEIPAEEMDKLEKDLKQIRSKTIFVFPDNITIDRFPTAEMKEMHFHLDFFTNAVCTGLGIKRELLMTPVVRTAGIDIISSREDFELDVTALQNLLVDQVNEELIEYRAKLKHTKDVPVLKLRSAQRAIKLSIARRRATLARAGLLTYDPEMEIKIRDEEGLPHGLLDAEKDEWKPEDRDKNKTGFESLIEDIVRKVLEENGRSKVE